MRRGKSLRYLTEDSNQKTMFDIKKYKLEIHKIKDKNVWKSTDYLSSIAVSTLYEIISGHFGGFEIGATKYDLSVVDKILKDKSFKLVCYENDSDDYDNLGRHTVLVFSEEKDAAIRLRINDANCSLSFYSGSYEIFDFLKTIKKFIHKKTDCEIGLFFQEAGRFVIRQVPIKSLEVDVERNYGKSFIDKHNKIINKMSEKSGGLYIFHGPPAGGKTSYIKYLSQKVDRPFVFIPAGLVPSIDSPALVSCLMDHKNPVLILEDAEKAVQSRSGKGDASLVSTLLNLSDGILSSMLDISLIVTFNTAKEEIDKALVRKGRLMVEHEFGPLSIEESNGVAEYLGKDIKFDKPQMLGDIYNYGDDNFHEEEKKEEVGFASFIKK